MLRTKHIITDISKVPEEWIFEYYLKLKEKLTGQDVKLTSVFNKKDSNPSMYVFYNTDTERYYFKCFSSDKKGTAFELVKILFDYSSAKQTAMRILNDYSQYILDGGEEFALREFKIRSKYKIKQAVPRNWNAMDKKYWMKYRIDSKLLEQYNVSPLDHYTLYKEDCNDELKLVGQCIYGYFTNKGLLYKIYTPLAKTRFFKVKDHIQGIDQLTYEQPYLVICSSMKDLLSFKKLGFVNAEVVAPDSENTLIPERLIDKFKDKYKNVCTLFDNDEPGLKAMLKYQDKFNIPYAHLKLEKDLSDSIEAHGIKNTRFHLYPVLTNALTGTTKNLPI